MPDPHGGDGFDVLDGRAQRLDERGEDLAEAMLRGARAVCALAESRAIDLAILTDRSAACRSQVISVGCRSEEPVDHRRGVGGAAALLLRRGFHVVSQRNLGTLALLGARLDPVLAPGPEVVDRHHHPWVIEHPPSEPRARIGAAFTR